MLRVSRSGARTWIWRGTVRSKRVDLGLGGFPYTTLAEARQKAFEYRKLARAGGDPRVLRRGVPTFAEAAEKVIAIHRGSWRAASGSEHIWRASLRDYAMPRMGHKRVDAITSADVMACLLPIWNTKRETARRVKQRISRVMRWCVAEGHRQDDPAGIAIDAALPRNGLKRVHHRALPHAEVATALDRVGSSSAWAGTKLAFEFLVLTATRVSEVRLATWDEIDFDSSLWTVPADRMKAGIPHRVPLCTRAMEVLAEARELTDGSGLVFSSVTGRPMSNSTKSKLLRELGIQAVPHGFRSSFRDWCGEMGHPRELAEAALAHVIPNKVEAAYARSDLFERRRALMEQWGEYVAESRRLSASSTRARE